MLFWALPLMHKEETRNLESSESAVSLTPCRHRRATPFSERLQDDLRIILDTDTGVPRLKRISTRNQTCQEMQTAKAR